MKQLTKILYVFILIAILIAAFIFVAGLNIIHEGEAGVLTKYCCKLKNTQNSRLVVLQPGLHFVSPMVGRVEKIDLRMQTDEFHSKAIYLLSKNTPSFLQKKILLDYFVFWQIKDPVRYFYSGQNDKGVENILSIVLERGMQSRLQNFTLPEIMTKQQEAINQTAINEINVELKPYGVEVADMGIVKADYSPEVSDTILSQLKEQYTNYTKNITVESDAKAMEKKVRVDAEARDIINKAKAFAIQMRAEGDAEAAVIENSAYRQSPEFYLWLKDLEVFKNNFTKDNKVIVIQPGGKFFKYLGKMP